MRVRTVLSVSAFLLAAGAIAWGVLNDARDARLQRFLTTIEGAEEQLPYVGTRLMGAGDAVQLRIWSANGHKRVDFLGFQGTPRPAGKSAGPRSPFAGGMPLFLRPGHDQWKRKIKDAALAVRNYDVVVKGRETIAGRDAELIEVRSRYRGRPSYRVAADLENRFPLKFEVLLDGERIFETRFSEIEYHPKFPDGIFEDRRRASWLNVSQEEMPAQRMSEAAGFEILRPAWLPPGFELRGSELLRVRAEISKELKDMVQPFLPLTVPKLEAPIAHFTYTDGLAVVAVVECSASSDLWRHLRKFLPATAPVGPDGSVVARRFTDRGGTAYLLEHEGTVVLAAGNVASDEIEAMIRTLERR